MVQSIRPVCVRKILERELIDMFTTKFILISQETIMPMVIEVNIVQYTLARHCEDSYVHV